MRAHSLLEHALENTSPYFTYKVGSGEDAVRLPDNDAIQLAHQKIEQIRTRFEEWLRELTGDAVDDRSGAIAVPEDPEEPLADLLQIRRVAIKKA